MVVGLFISLPNGVVRRPKSKKEVREAIARDPYGIIVENTSIYGGAVQQPGQMENGDVVTFVGPDPYTSRVFYGNIVKTAKGFTVK